MTAGGPRVLAALTLLLVGAAGLAVAASASRSAETAQRSRAFQQLAHGLGFGPATDLSQGEADFDPRVGDGCGAPSELVPAGGAFCARRICAALISR